MRRHEALHDLAFGQVTRVNSRAHVCKVVRAASNQDPHVSLIPALALIVRREIGELRLEHHVRERRKAREFGIATIRVERRPEIDGMTTDDEDPLRKNGSKSCGPVVSGMDATTEINLSRPKIHPSERRILLLELAGVHHPGFHPALIAQTKQLLAEENVRRRRRFW